METQLLEITRSIYAASTDISKWDIAVSRIARLLKAPSSTLAMLSMNSPDESVFSAYNVSPQAVEDYTQYYWKHDIWINKSGGIPAGKTVNGWDLVTPKELRDTEFYNDCAKNIGAFNLCTTKLKCDPSIFSFYQISRPEGQMDFDQQERDLFSLFVPHLQQAVEINLRIGRLVAANKLYEQTLNALPYGILLINRRGKLVFANKIVEQILTRQDGLTVKQGQFMALRHADNVTLTTLIRECIDTATGTGLKPGGYLNLARPSGKQAYTLLIAPLPKDESTNIALFLDHEPAVLIFLGDPDRIDITPAQQLQKLYGLTAAEARLAQALMTGESLNRIAERQCISIETARTQLKRVFQKTGTHRQSELVRLLLLIPRTLPGADMLPA